MTNNDLNIQAKDFFRSGSSGAVVPPKHPENIQWLINNFAPQLQGEYDAFVKKNTNYLGYDSSLRNLLMNKKFVLKRIQDLKSKGLKLSNEGVAIVRYGSLEILKEAIDCGLDINYIDDKINNYPLRTAVLRKKTKIAEYLWSLPNINKDYFDESGYNIAHLSIEREMWSLVTKIWKDNPEKFFEENKNSNLIGLDYFKGVNFERIPNKYFDDIQNIVKSLIAECSRVAQLRVGEDSSITEKEIKENIDRLNSLDNYEELRDLKVILEYEKLHKSVTNKKHINKPQKI